MIKKVAWTGHRAHNKTTHRDFVKGQPFHGYAWTSLCAVSRVTRLGVLAQALYTKPLRAGPKKAHSRAGGECEFYVFATPICKPEIAKEYLATLSKGWTVAKLVMCGEG
jgi:hypothetical protein